MISEYPGGIILESGPLESTGGKVWKAAIEFFEYVQCLPEINSGGCRVIELGSGCGWLGLRLSKHFGNIHLTMTEQGNFGALAWLEHNVELNKSIRVNVCELDWANILPEISEKPWDLILGSELVYSYEGARLLPRVIHELLNTPNSVCYYCHSLFRFEAIDEVLISEFKANNLRFEVVHGLEAFESLGSYSSLFPELETVIFKLVRNT
jgi:hypothetical protein